MENELKAEGEPELRTKRKAKRIEFPDNVISRLTGIPQEEIKKQRYDNGIALHTKWLIPAQQSSRQKPRIITPVLEGFNEAEKTEGKRKSWFLAPARSVSARVLSSISVPYTAPGHSPRRL